MIFVLRIKWESLLITIDIQINVYYDSLIELTSILVAVLGLGARHGNRGELLPLTQQLLVVGLIYLFGRAECPRMKYKLSSR